MNWMDFMMRLLLAVLLGFLIGLDILPESGSMC